MFRRHTYDVLLVLLFYSLTVTEPTYKTFAEYQVSKLFDNFFALIAYQLCITLCFGPYGSNEKNEETWNK